MERLHALRNRIAHNEPIHHLPLRQWVSTCTRGYIPIPLPERCSSLNDLSDSISLILVGVEHFSGDHQAATMEATGKSGAKVSEDTEAAHRESLWSAGSTERRIPHGQPTGDAGVTGCRSDR